jgi:hypothetical protein
MIFSQKGPASAVGFLYRIGILPWSFKYPRARSMPDHLTPDSIHGLDLDRVYALSRHQVLTPQLPLLFLFFMVPIPRCADKIILFLRRLH